MNNFEIEIKSLLGEKEAADKLIEKMKVLDSRLQELGRHTQLNHYFISGDLKLLSEKLKNLLPENHLTKFKDLANKATDYSLRSRSADGKIILVMKVAIDNSTSSNGVARREFESVVPLSLDELDKLLLNCGFNYQAKWSRERQTFKYKGYDVMIDKNAGYGYLVEFEKLTTDSAEAEAIKSDLRKIIKELGVEELNQDRLARMFEHYNTHWQDYYGTDKTFIID
jgi:predicted adenylyl cyclase CyaB